tara:strand:+ start:86 stop:889 length:804 start_codon:yes stop_codon:yes gene_type:complete
MLSIVFIENLANKNEGKNFSSSEKSRFNQTQSNNFIKKIDSKKMAVLPVKNKEYISVSEKKKRFINSLLPIVKDTNLEILEKRNVLFHIDKKIKNNNLNVLEAKVLKKMFREYKIKNNDISELKKRLDIVPISMAIAQAAIESGWGTSRFALEGNAYFGQKTVGLKTNGIRPNDIENPRIKIRIFNNINDSVKAYINNLNTHFAYKNFRKSRNELRSFGKTLEGITLVKQLNKYSELGDEYVSKVQKVIKENNLNKYDFIEYRSAKR